MTASVYETIANDILEEARKDSQKLHDMVATVKTAKGSADDVKKWIEASEEETVVKRRNAIASAKAKIAEIEAELQAEARAAIVPDDIDVNKIQEAFKATRADVVKTLSAARLILGKAGVADLSEIDELQNNLPKSITGIFSGSGKSPEELAAVRKWARENGHEVAEQGRIAKAIQDEYDEAHKG
jgi:23S rRNA maturation mini-RNase III